MKSRLLSNENLTLFAIVAGVLFGILLPEIALQQKLIGDVFLQLLKMLIIPLIFASVFVAVVGLGSVADLKNLGLRVILYYLSTTSLAVITGLIVVNLFDPGAPLEPIEGETFTPKTVGAEELVLSLFPSNLFAALAEGKALQVIFFAILFGVAALFIAKEKKETLHRFFDGVHDALLVLAGWIVKLTPLGVFSILSYIIAKNGVESLLGLWEFALTVLVGLLFHAIVVLPVVASVFGRFNPYAYFLKVREAVLLAFSTASSSATLPVSLRVAEEHGNVKKKAAGFVLPLGATVNMDGSALYESVAVLFIATLAGVQLGFGDQVLIVIAATLTSVGVAGIPSASLVMITMILGMLGLPIEYVGMILVVDRFLDMLRTGINVWGDLLGAKILERYVR